jgi:enterochelin esterase-like enzyme
MGSPPLPGKSASARFGHAASALMFFLAACAPTAASPSPQGTIPPARPSPTAFPPSPEATASPTPACAEPGRWTDFSYDAVAMPGEGSAVVYLPPCYLMEDERYPTAYFLHGKPYTEQQWIDLGLPGVVEAAVADGSLPPLILVLARQPEPLFSNSDGGPGSYETEFVDGLVAAIDGSFRTEARPEGRAVIGLSRGGVWALEIAMRNPALIDAVAALSPSLAVNYARAAYDPLQLAATADRLPPDFLLAAGDEDWARGETEALAAQLSARGITPQVVIVPGDHTDPTWATLLPVVTAFLQASLSAE